MFFWGLLNTGQIRPEEALRGRCNSFVVETHVHFPTDINLLLDDMRKSITLSAQWCQELGLSDWHQWAYNLRQVKQPMRSAENQKHSKARSPEQLEKNQALIVKARQAHMKVAQTYLEKVAQTLAKQLAMGQRIDTNWPRWGRFALARRSVWLTARRTIWNFPLAGCTTWQKGYENRSRQDASSADQTGC